MERDWKLKLRYGKITTDEKINLNVIDSGSLMFAKNSQTNAWSLYYDFY